MVICLEPLTSDLLPAAVDLDRLCFGQLWTLNGYQREIDSPNSDLLILQPRSSKDSCHSQPLPILALGCLWAILEEAHIIILAVQPDYQRQGLGQSMLLGLVASAWRRGLEWVTLEVRVSNTAAIALYKKFGFQPVGYRRQYYPDTKEDALILWLSGLQKPEFPKKLRIWDQEVRDRLATFNWVLSELGIPNAPLDSCPPSH